MIPAVQPAAASERAYQSHRVAQQLALAVIKCRTLISLLNLNLNEYNLRHGFFKFIFIHPRYRLGLPTLEFVSVQIASVIGLGYKLCR